MVEQSFAWKRGPQEVDPLLSLEMMTNCLGLKEQLFKGTAIKLLGAENVMLHFNPLVKVRGPLP
jgi:hypothetical protein